MHALILYLGQNKSSSSPPLHILASPISKARNSQTFGSKLVGDNLDKNVKARYMRSDKHHNQSLHCFHSFAIKNRIDFSHLSDVQPHSCANSPHNTAVSLLPSADDDRLLRKNFGILISRVLVTHMPFFKCSFDGVITWHIMHKYYEQMCRKSTVVSNFR